MVLAASRPNTPALMLQVVLVQVLPAEVHVDPYELDNLSKASAGGWRSTYCLLHDTCAVKAMHAYKHTHGPICAPTRQTPWLAPIPLPDGVLFKAYGHIDLEMWVAAEALRGLAWVCAAAKTFGCDCCRKRKEGGDQAEMMPAPAHHPGGACLAAPLHTLCLPCACLPCACLPHAHGHCRSPTAIAGRCPCASPSP